MMKQKCDKSVQVLSSKLDCHCGQQVKSAALKVMAVMSDEQYFLGCKGVGKADEQAAAFPYVEHFYLFFPNSVNGSVINCRSAVVSVSPIRIYSSNVVMACPSGDNHSLMRATSDCYAVG
ncbi:hypothetical protein EVA_03725 [gut metagenome]|uniref:Uncharacterized protein n=1 Tax=gut metagenome TaxID=749906 RepID=J9GK74_9ZZZZ